MKAESEVSIPFAISIFLDKEFTPDDDTLNYESYKKLGLTCGKCRELVFFKRCKERVSHFSHFNETGKGCEWKTKNNTNTSKQDTDSESREQSLQKFQIKFHRILDRGIITYQNISEIQLKNCKVQGKILVDKYRIDIEPWLSEFNKEREKETEPIRELALSIYKNNNKLSEIQCRFLANLVDYLCVPASKYIFEDTLYYVFYLLNKNVSVNNDYQEVCSKVIEIVSFADWEIEEKETPKHQKLKSNKVKPYLLDGSKAVSGQYIFKGVLGSVPCIFKMIPNGRQYNMVALPIKCHPLAVAQYVAGHYPNLVSMPYLERQIEKYSNPNNKIKNRENLVLLLTSLLKDVINGIKLDPNTLLAATKAIEKSLNNADFNSLVDDYYRLHNLGTGQFIQEVNTERYQYLVTDYGKNYRRGIGSDVNSVINWIRNCPRNLNEKFGHKAATITEIKEFLDTSFKSKFNTKNVSLVVYEHRQKFLEIYYRGELEIQQLITIVSPATDGKTTNLTSTNTNFKPAYNEDNAFEAFLDCKESEFLLVRETRKQLEKMVNRYVSSNYQTLVGDNKVFKETKISSLVGFTPNSTKKGYSQIVKTFLKYVRPYLAESEVNKGKLINLNTLKTLTEREANELIGKISDNWKNWKYRDVEIIPLGDGKFKKPDPGLLMLCVTGAIHQKPHSSQIIWRDLIDVFYQLSGLPIGFKCSNGCVLTPHSMYETGIIRWNHRIKIQLIDLLLKEKSERAKEAQIEVNRSIEVSREALEDLEIARITASGKIEAWLQLPIERLYFRLETIDPQWEISLANEDIEKHLKTMHDALNISIEVESSLQ